MIKFIKSLFGFPTPKPYVPPKFNPRRNQYSRNKDSVVSNTDPLVDTLLEWPLLQEDRPVVTHNHFGNHTDAGYHSSLGYHSNDSHTSYNSDSSSSSSDSGGGSGGD